MFTKNVKFKNFKKKISKTSKISLSKNLIYFLNSNNEIVNSMKSFYQDAYSKNLIKDLKKINNINLIGMGGSSIGAKALYNFLKPSKKKFVFIDNFTNFKPEKQSNSKINLIISKSGNTLETISNFNILKKKHKNIFITGEKKSYLRILAEKLKADVVKHNNYIGGRYSVLSEVGMLPSELMGYKPEKFRRLNHLIKNKFFFNALINNVYNILDFVKNKKTNSIILNYDDRSNDLFCWYQQLVAESLGKKGKGILPVISTMPKDNHSLMQYYLDGEKKNFYTFFFVKEKGSPKLIRDKLLEYKNLLNGKTLNDVAFSQFQATEKVFKEKKLPFRSFIIGKRNEQTLGELFSFFMIETILIAKALSINPFDQPAVELIKKNTKKFLKKKL